MRNAHIAFVMYPQYPSVGLALPVVSVLARRGYRVTYVAPEDFAPRLRDAGAEVIPGPGRPEARVYEDRSPEAKHSEPFHKAHIQLALSTLDQIKPFYETNRPALILYESGVLAARILIRVLGSAAAQISPTFSLDRRNFSRQIPDRDFREYLLEGSRHLDEFFMSYGIENGDLFFHREGLNIFLFSRALQPSPDPLDMTCFYAGRCAGEQPYFGDWRRKHSDDRPVVLVTTSTQYVRGSDYFRMCIEALSGLPWHIVLSIGDGLDPAALSPLPPGFEIVQHTSHIKILAYASLMICLGGIATSSEAAYFGVPLVVTSHGHAELEWQAENLARLGLAIHLTAPETNVDSVRLAATDAIQNATLLSRARAMQRIVRREGGAEEAANRIEEYLEDCYSRAQAI